MSEYASQNTTQALASVKALDRQLGQEKEFRLAQQNRANEQHQRADVLDKALLEAAKDHEATRTHLEAADRRIAELEAERGSVSPPAEPQLRSFFASSQERVRIRAERDFLEHIVGHRDMGISATALVKFALDPDQATIDATKWPHDNGDLGRCERITALMPDHLKEKVAPWLAFYRTYVQNRAIS